MKVFTMPQLSPEWWAVRRGVPTSSEFNRIITPAKGELSAQASDYIAELIADRACQSPNYFTEKGRPVNSYAIQNGIDLEPEARRWLSFDANLDVTEVGFIMSDDLRFGCSPDGMIGLQMAAQPSGEWNGQPFYDATADATLELKCPLPKTQTAYLLTGALPVEYRPQCHGHLFVADAVTACEFVSYSNVLPPLRARVERDEYTAKLTKALNAFWDQYQLALGQVQAMC